jgi:hypothetical protein
VNFAPSTNASARNHDRVDGQPERRTGDMRSPVRYWSSRRVRKRTAIFAAAHLNFFAAKKPPKRQGDRGRQIAACWLLPLDQQMAGFNTDYDHRVSRTPRASRRTGRR